MISINRTMQVLTTFPRSLIFLLSTARYYAYKYTTFPLVILNQLMQFVLRISRWKTQFLQSGKFAKMALRINGRCSDKDTSDVSDILTVSFMDFHHLFNNSIMRKALLTFHQ